MQAEAVPFGWRMALALSAQRLSNRSGWRPFGVANPSYCVIDQIDQAVALAHVDGDFASGRECT